MDANWTALALAPPAACLPQSGYSWHGNFMLGGSVYAMVLVVVCTVLAYTIYCQRPELSRQGEERIVQLGSLGVISTFFLSLGVFIAGHVVHCGLGCSTFASECASISCLVANFMPEGYVTLALLLLAACVGVLQNVNELALQRMSIAGITGAFTFQAGSGIKGVLGFLGEWLIRIGFVMTVVTGLIPSPMSNCGLQPGAVTLAIGDDCFAQVMSKIHTTGVIGGLVLASIGNCIRLFAPRRVGHEWRTLSDKLTSLDCHKCTMLLLVVFSFVFLFLVSLGFLVVYAANDSGAASEVDFCPKYKTQAACLGQELPHAWYSWAAARRQDDSDKLTVDGWQCEWFDNISTISTGCMRANCDKNGRLGNNRLAIVAEFLGLVMGVYGIHFSLWATSMIDVTIGIETKPSGLETEA